MSPTPPQSPGLNPCGARALLHQATALPFSPLTSVLPQFLLDKSPFPTPALFPQVSAQKAKLQLAQEGGCSFGSPPEVFGFSPTLYLTSLQMGANSLEETEENASKQ